MVEFPQFMRRTANKVDASQQYTEDIEGYYYNGADGGQMAFWTCRADRTSEMHEHNFDEYIVVIDGCYTLCTQKNEVMLKNGGEAFIPAGTKHWGKCCAGTRTIHAFGGKRIPID